MLGAFGFLADDLPVPNPNKSPKSPKISLNPSKPDVEYVYVPPPNGPPAPPKPWLGSAVPNWSYIFLFCGLDKTSYASFTSLNFASASSLLSGLASGWYFFARRLYAFFSSSSVAVFSTPKTS